MSINRAKVYTSTSQMKPNSVYICSGGGIMHVLFVAESQEEAIAFCDLNNWEWMGENGFCWILNYTE